MMVAMRLAGLLVSLMAFVPACGDDGGGEGTAGTSSTSAGSTSGGATGSTGGSAEGTATAADTTAATGETTTDATSSTGSTTSGTGTTDATTTSDATTSDATTDASTTGGMGMLDVQMSGLQIFEDCMPIVPPDPVGASFSLELDNIGDVSASATVTAAAFFDAGGMQVATIDVMPAAFGPIPVGAVDLAMVSKVPGSLMPAAGCEVLACNQSYTLELRLDVDGMEVLASDMATVDCVF